MLLVVLIVAALGLFLTGLPRPAVRASASNPDTRARYTVRRVSTIVWAISGAFAATTAILIAPFSGVQAALVDDTGQTLAEVLLLRVLIVSLLARMRSIPGVLVSGIGVGVIETIVKGNVATTNQTIVDVFMLIAVLVVVLWLARSQREAGGWTLSPRAKPSPDRLRTVFWVRNLNRIGFAALFGALAVLPVFATTSAGCSLGRSS